MGWPVDTGFSGKRWLVGALGVLAGYALDASAVDVLTEPFDNSSRFVASTPFFSDGGFDYFGIADGSGGGDFGGDPAPSGIKAYTGFDGSFLTGMDLNGEGATVPFTVEWTGIDISGLTGLQFSGDFAEFFDDPGDIDADDYILVEASIDGGAYEKVLEFRLDQAEPDNFNGIFREDTDFEGRGDGVALGNAAQNFTKAIAGAGTTLDLRLSVRVEAGDEDFGVDNFIVSSGATVEPTPALISEFEPNPPGTDPSPVSFELSGTPGDSFSGVISAIEGDLAGGEVDSAEAVSGTFDANGLLTVLIDDLENPSFTVVLSSEAPVVGTAIDSDQNGVVDDPSVFGVVFDAVGVPDEPGDAGFLFGAELGGADFTFTGDEPVLVFRESSVGDFFAVNPGGQINSLGGAVLSPGDFDADPANGPTFGTVNPAYTGGAIFTPRKIHEIQGTGPTVTNPGELVEVQAVVTGLFESVVNAVAALDGFFIQEEDTEADADSNTSEGIFVFCRGSCPALAEGDLVTVQGTATDFFGMSQIDATGGSISKDSTGFTLPFPTTVTLPAAGPTNAEATFEAFEGMLVNFPQDLVVAEYFQLARFGEVVLSEGPRPRQFTDEFAPDVAGYQQHLDDLARSRIILDDLNNNQNADDPVYYPRPNGFSTTDFFRGGDTVGNLTGVLHWSFAGAGGTDAWRVRPTRTAPPVFTPENTRTTAPADVGGNFRIATLNVLNYFNTIDEGSNVCGPGGAGCRGADSEAERDRQLAKITAALQGMDADIVGLVELENDADDATLASLVAALPGYDYIATGFIGTDAIKVGIIYKPASTTPVGGFAILDSTVDSNFIDTKNRPALIQTFEDNASGERFTIAVNHFKSKGSPCDDVGDPLSNDGQGNCNGVRTDAAIALANYLQSDPTSSGDPDFLILGDLNAYSMEDPITALEQAGYANLVSLFQGLNAYSYLFDGQLGYLDHALATPSITALVSGVAAWHINADEVNLLDYNDAIQDESEQSFEAKPGVNELYSADPYRASDHDPLIIGLDLGGSAAITDLVARASSGRVQLSWTGVAAASGYNVYRSTTAGGPYALIAADVASALLLDTGVTNGVEYFYVVRVRGSDGTELSTSNEASATPNARRRRR